MKYVGMLIFFHKSYSHHLDAQKDDQRKCVHTHRNDIISRPSDLWRFSICSMFSLLSETLPFTHDFSSPAVCVKEGRITKFPSLKTGVLTFLLFTTCSSWWSRIYFMFGKSPSFCAWHLLCNWKAIETIARNQNSPLHYDWIL